MRRERVKMNACTFTFITSTILTINIKYIVGSPVVSNSIDFEDKWDYKLTPHNVPLLNGSSKIHLLPTISKDGERKRGNEVKRIGKSSRKLGDAVRSKVSCSMCKLGVGLLLRERAKRTPFDEIKQQFVGLCVALKVENEIVCTGIFDVYGPDVLAALEYVQIGAAEICSLVLGEVCGDVPNPLHQWNITLPAKPALDAEDVLDLPKEGLPTFKVLHISDTHYDPDYEVGSPSNCQEPLCCHGYSTPSETEDLIPAGKWGSYKNCDAPKILLENMLQHITEKHPDIDYILWTGDIPPHDIWNQTRRKNLALVEETVDLLYAHFPATPVFPALGNHESVPAGSFAPPWVPAPERSVAWLYGRAADHWRRWLPASAGATVLHGGFYSVLVRPGFRIVGLNTNYCHTLSWWLIVNSTDPAAELRWLVHELGRAEAAGERVHLVGHIPPGSADCMRVWSENFHRVVERFERTVVAQFYGHTHADEFEMFYAHDGGDSRPTGVAFLGPSVTTYDDFNPAYRIYYVDGDHDRTTREVIDHETWTMDLAAANGGDKDPAWYRLYSARDAFRMQSLRPAEWDKLINDLAADPDLFEMFYKLYYRDSPTRPPCDNQCKLQILCDLRSGMSHHRRRLCRDLELMFA